MVRVAILTVSDSAASGERLEDVGGRTAREVVESYGFTVVDQRIVADDRAQIQKALIDWADAEAVDLIVTTGGTGLAPRDVTPDATLEVIERQVPGMAEVMRAVSLTKTPAAMLSRAVVGVRRKALIVNLPGNPKGVRECLDAIQPALQHAVDSLRGSVGQHDRPHAH